MSEMKTAFISFDFDTPKPYPYRIVVKDGDMVISDTRDVPREFVQDHLSKHEPCERVIVDPHTFNPDGTPK